jgi:3-phosphoshikimate 1-carboxyvinyltransferase
MRRVMDPLTAMGASLNAHEFRPPLDIRGGPLQAIDWTTTVPSAQVKSAVLFAGLYANGVTTVREALPTRDHTERALVLFRVDHSAAPGVCRVSGPQRPTAPAAILRVPGDPSSAAVWATAAAVVPGASVEIEDVCLNPQRIGFVRVLERMGAEVAIIPSDDCGGEPVGTLRVSCGAARAVIVTPDEVPSLIDELPLLAAGAALAGGIEVTGAGELRVKETDRISALVRGLRALGAEADERPDGFVVGGRRRGHLPPAGGRADADGDHRLVMAFAVLALGSRGPTVVDGAGSVAVSYPGFLQDLEALARW